LRLSKLALFEGRFLAKVAKTRKDRKEVWSEPFCALYESFPALQDILFRKGGF
jgi:hypothetical protein